MSEDRPTRRRSQQRWPPIREVMTNVFALVVVGLWALAIGRQILWPTDQSLQYAGQISALLGPILGAVIGLYFGTNAGERVADLAAERVDEALEDKAETKQFSAERVAELERQLAESIAETARLRELVEQAVETGRYDSSGGASPVQPSERGRGD
jgi:hypothetical protein